MLLAGAAVMSLVLFSCKKETTTPDDSSDQTTQASDDAKIEGNVDQALDDANTAVGDVQSMSGKTTYIPICGATIDTTQKSSGIITITYDGTTACVGGTVTRGGSIQLTLTGGQWKDAGAKITIAFTNYKVTRISDGKSITFNGSKSITNVNGGLVSQITGSATVVHKAHGSLNITFDDGTVRSWNIARKRTYSLNGSSVLQIKVEGDTTITYANTVIWGTNRKGSAFNVVISTPIEANATCGWHKPTTGVRIHKGLARELTVTFGVDNAGNPVSSGCAYGYKLNWTNAKGTAKQAVINY